MTLYVREWDGWQILAVYYFRELAQSHVQSSMENIEEYNIHGDIIDDNVYIVLDKFGDWQGIYTTEQEANCIVGEYPDWNNFLVKMVKVQ